MKDATKRDLALLRRGIELNKKFEKKEISSEVYMREVKKIILAYSNLVEDLTNERKENE